jgi:cytochrome c biogenesis protein CcmG/thiol:disulfide interchange protein DsbE
LKKKRRKKMNNTVKWILITAVAALIITLVVLAGKKSPAAVVSAPANGSAPAAPASCTGKAAPDFTYTDINGKNLSLSGLRGKVVILDFWATWCPPCKMEIPGFVQLQKQYEKEGLMVVGIALDTEEKVKNFAKEYGINYPLAIGDQSITQAYGGIQGIPTTFIIDKTGCIVGQHVGYRPKEVFEQEFLKLK